MLSNIFRKGKRFQRWLNRPRVIRTINFWATTFWVGLIIPTVFLWSRSILWVALLSIWANVISHYTAYLAARVEVREEDIETTVEHIEDVEEAEHV